MIRDLTYLTADMGWSFKHHREPEKVDTQVHHRTHVERHLHDERRISKVVDFFRKKDHGTGGRFPYHFLIARSGAIAQMVPLQLRAPGAKNWNTRGIHIGWEGDFRSEEPSGGQWISAVWLASQLDKMGATRIAGHMELANASSDPNKICPGPLLDMDDFREDVAANLFREAKEAGLKWPAAC